MHASEHLQRITTGQLQGGDRVPGEMALTEEFSVSVPTVRQARQTPQVELYFVRGCRTMPRLGESRHSPGSSKQTTTLHSQRNSPRQSTSREAFRCPCQSEVTAVQTTPSRGNAPGRCVWSGGRQAEFAHLCLRVELIGRCIGWFFFRPTLL